VRDGRIPTYFSASSLLLDFAGVHGSFQPRFKILEIRYAPVQSGVGTMRKTLKKGSAGRAVASGGGGSASRTAAVSDSPARVAPSRSNVQLTNAAKCILTINGGSSSIKFALYRANSSIERLVSGKLERIGFSDSSIAIKDKNGSSQKVPVKAPNHRAGGDLILRWLDKNFSFDCVVGVGHRVVHGGPKFKNAQRITPALVKELRRLSPYDPEHLPSGIQLMESFREHYPDVPQIACFDTAFHSDMPRVAKILPIPRRFDKKGVQRFGFHGISYSYLMEELQRLCGSKVANGRIILAHLGNGASMAAVRNGKCIDTTMGFTPAAGLPMSTRSGDLDPGLVWYLARTEHMTAQKFHDMVHHESGLLGVSETSPDMRDLLAREKKDVRAAEAVAMFCYQARKWIGTFTAALGGLDTLLFAGGIGENAPIVRARICDGLQFLGLKLDQTRNKLSASVISAPRSKVTVRVIRTDEERMLARSVIRVLRLNMKSK
jgi:acetate kinase